MFKQIPQIFAQQNALAVGPQKTTLSANKSVEISFRELEKEK